jgi:hypothetical protein
LNFETIKAKPNLEKEGFIVWKDKKPINMEQYNDIDQSINEAFKLI